MNPEPPPQPGIPASAIPVTDGDGTDGSDRRRGTPPPARTLSQVLTDIAADPSRDRITLNDLITLLGGRGRAALILLFALPNVVPAPPGVSGVLGLPLLYLSFQMMLGRQPWLPRLIGARSLPRDRFARLVGALAPWLARAERLLRPRLSLLVNHTAEYAIGAVCLVLACILTLPIPLGNMLPAFAICLIALGVLGRDGVWVLAGVLTGVASLFVVAGVVYALVESLIYLFLDFFG